MKNLDQDHDPGQTFADASGPQIDQDTDRPVEPVFSRVGRLRYFLQVYSEQLNEAHRQVMAGEFSKLKDEVAAAKELLATSKALTEAETKVEENLLKQAGKLSHDDIDFDAVRSEVRSRLARLRDAGGSGPVSD